ncbi:unnamed protein product [Pleuronectes platessa]|uniref:Uncharacterized protein n=1 Tax=Pleuronectes platessa TaxID=8262 RepID=A0A9N7UK92_PLEPL|nr:unnamed protein product [Pleuronectes platessa]
MQQEVLRSDAFNATQKSLEHSGEGWRSRQRQHRRDVIAASTCSRTGIRKGLPLDATRRQSGTSVPGSGLVHFWGLLLQCGPLGTSELGQRQLDTSPTPLPQLDSGGLKVASSQIQHLYQAAGNFKASFKAFGLPADVAETETIMPL